MLRCGQPEHEEWWGTTPFQPATAFYTKTSKCKKCYIRVRQTERYQDRPSILVQQHDTSRSQLLERDLKRYHTRYNVCPITLPSDMGYPVTVSASKPASSSSLLLSSLSTGECEALYGVSRTHHYPLYVLTNARYCRGRRFSPAFARRFLDDRAAGLPCDVVLDHSNSYASPESLALLFSSCREALSHMAVGLSKELLQAVLTPVDSPHHPKHAVYQKTPSLQQERMDLRSLEQRVHCRRYRTFGDFAKDALTVWSTVDRVYAGSNAKLAAEIRAARQQTADRLDQLQRQLAEQYLASLAGLCAVCRETPRVGGRPLLPCDGACFRSFHLSCTFPELIAAPAQSEYWLCNDCRNGRLVYHWDPDRKHYFCLDFSDALRRFEAVASEDNDNVDDDDDNDDDDEKRDAEHVQELIVVYDPVSPASSCSEEDDDGKDGEEERQTKLARRR